MSIPRDDVESAEDSPLLISRDDGRGESPLPGERPLEPSERIVAIDLRTRDLAGEVARFSYKLGALDGRMVDFQAKVLKALATLTDKINQTAPHREKLDTLSEMAIQNAIEASQAKARDNAHEAQLAAQSLDIAKLNKAMGTGAIVGVVGTAVGTLLLKLFAWKYGIALP
jgi:hypothetical protein